MLIKAIIFDFDGVIVESVDVKTNAFRELFKGYPDKLDSILRYHLENGGVSRYDKFRYIYKNILEKELSGAEFNSLCASFNKLVFEDVVKAPFVKGVIEFLDYCLKKYPMYVISATPEEEARAIIRKKELAKYFIEIYGAPTSKPESIKAIIKDRRTEASKVLFIGDSRNDYQAACETGILFIARAVDREQEWLKSPGIKTVISDFVKTKNIFSI